MHHKSISIFGSLVKWFITNLGTVFGYKYVSLKKIEDNDESEENIFNTNFAWGVIWGLILFGIAKYM